MKYQVNCSAYNTSLRLPVTTGSYQVNCITYAILQTKASSHDRYQYFVSCGYIYPFQVIKRKHARRNSEAKPRSMDEDKVNHTYCCTKRVGKINFERNDTKRSGKATPHQIRKKNRKRVSDVSSQSTPLLKKCSGVRRGTPTTI